MANNYDGDTIGIDVVVPIEADDVKCVTEFREKETDLENFIKCGAAFRLCKSMNAFLYGRMVGILPEEDTDEVWDAMHMITKVSSNADDYMIRSTNIEGPSLCVFYGDVSVPVRNELDRQVRKEMKTLLDKFCKRFEEGEQDET